LLSSSMAPRRWLFKYSMSAWKQHQKLLNILLQNNKYEWGERTNSVELLWTIAKHSCHRWIMTKIKKREQTTIRKQWNETLKKLG
jgi:hypothetical protein